jgi:3-oxoacyl-[acyl-carrier protein] reductase
MDILKDKTVLVTGASRGIGRATALKLAAEGVRLILTGRSRDSLNETEDLVAELGVKSIVLTADFSSMESVYSLVSAIKEKVSLLDGIINNAGQALSASIEESSEQDWDRIMTVNAKAPFFLTKELLPLMEKSDFKRIVNIASVVGHEGYPLQSIYTASKHALTGWSKAMAREFQDRGYRIHVISPGGVATDMVTGVRPDIDVDQLIHPREIAEWIVFLMSRTGKGMVDSVNIRRESKMAW